MNRPAFFSDSDHIRYAWWLTLVIPFLLLMGLTLTPKLYVVLPLLLGMLFLVKFPRVFCLLLILLLPIRRSGPLDSSLSLIKLVLTGSLFLVAMLQSRQKLKQADMTALFLFFLLALITAISYAFSGIQTNNFQYILEMYISIMMVPILLCLMNRGFLRHIIRILIILSLGVGMLSMIQFCIIKYHLGHPILLSLIPQGAKVYFFDMGNTMGSALVRLPSIFYHPNDLGHFAMVLFGFIFPIFLVTKHRISKVILLGSLFNILICAIISQSRSALMVIGLEGVFICWLLRKTSRVSLNKMFLGSLFMVGIFYFFFGSHVHQIMERVSEHGLSHREVNWSYGLQLLRNPTLFGTGPATSSYQIITSFPFIDQYYNNLLWDLLNYGKIHLEGISHPHNFLINLLIETGILSLLIYISIWAFVFIKSMSLLKRNPPPLVQAIVIGVMVPWLGSFIRGLVESYCFFQTIDVGALFGVFIAILVYWEKKYLSLSTKSFAPAPHSDSFQELDSLDKEIKGHDSYPGK